MKGRAVNVLQRAQTYLSTYGLFTFSIITRYEILRGLKAKTATKQIAQFEQQCSLSNVIPLTDEIVVIASDVYAYLRTHGHTISDADILIAATAIQQGLTLVTENVGHFSHIHSLNVESWR